MSQKEQQLEETEDNHSVFSSEWSLLDPCGDENAIQNESNSKIALLEAKLQMAEAAHLEEKMKLLEEKQIQANKYSELEAKMRKILTNKVTNSFGNPQGIQWWDESVSKYVTISSDGLQAKVEYKINVIATQGFPISAEHWPKDPFLWTIYYYEVTQMSQYGFAYWTGLSNGHIPYDSSVGWKQNSYSIARGCDLYLNSGIVHDFEWPDRAIKPEWKGLGNVVGCGITIDRNGKLSLFTLNGIILGRQISIEPTGDHLFPTVTIWDMTLEANFGHDPAKPFKYDIVNCPALDLM